MAEFKELFRQVLGTRSQAEVARAMGYSPATVSRMLNGFIPITSRMALRIAKEYPQLRDAAIQYIEGMYDESGEEAA